MNKLYKNNYHLIHDEKSGYHLYKKTGKSWSGVTINDLEELKRVRDMINEHIEQFKSNPKE